MCWMSREEGDVLPTLPRLDTRNTFGVFVVGFWVKGDAFEVLTTVVAEKAFRMEA